jgi:hypothetical protein
VDGGALHLDVEAAVPSAVCTLTPLVGLVAKPGRSTSTTRLDSMRRAPFVSPQASISTSRWRMLSYFDTVTFGSRSMATTASVGAA